MKNFEQFKKDFKQDFLIKVIISLKHSRIRMEEARSMAGKVIAIFENEEPKEVFTLLSELMDTHPQILDIFIKRAYEYDQREKEEKIPQILVYLSKGIPIQMELWKMKGGEN